jgi:cell wall-associated NlpC family hydrolase
MLLGWIVPSLAQPADPLADFLHQRGWAPMAPAPGFRPQHSSLVVHAMGFVGVPYRLGGGSYESGVDCSGFVQAAYRQSMGVELPRTVAEQAQATAAIEREALSPGDLVFFNTLGSRFSHVGIYIGQGRFIHSPRSGASVRLERLQTPYWAARFTGARRVTPSEPLTVALQTPGP